MGSTHATGANRVHLDYYATPEKAVSKLLKLEKFSHHIWEPACGGGHISEVLKKAGHQVKSSDILVRNYPCEQLDFISMENQTQFQGDIITNPPFVYAQEFTEKALSVIPKGNKVALFMRLLFLEGKKKKDFLTRFPIQTVYVSSSRISCAENGNFAEKKNSAICYAWFIWEKGYRGDTTLKLFN